jgi:hypothetical protein
MGPWGVRVKLVLFHWFWGRTLEEIRAKFLADKCSSYLDLPDFLVQPPEPEDMHTVTGYDS